MSQKDVKRCSLQFILSASARFSSMLLSRIHLKWSQTSRVGVCFANISLQSGHWQWLSQYPVTRGLQKLWPQAMETGSLKSFKKTEHWNCSSHNRLLQEAMPATLRKPQHYFLENIWAGAIWAFVFHLLSYQYVSLCFLPTLNKPD